MKKIVLALTTLTLVFWAASAFAQAANTLTAQEKSQGWQLLFDGKTLKGWHSATPPQRGARAGAPPATQPAAAPPAPAAPAAQPAAPAAAQTGTPKPCTGARGDATVVAPAGGSHWEVVGGSIVGCGEPAGYLVSDQSYKNFVLSVDFKCSAETNSGIYVRSPKEAGGYEVQIWNDQPAGYNTGGIVGTGRTDRRFDIKPNDWNHYEITADGDHLIVVLNGEKTLDMHDARFAEGNVRFQYQMYPIEFRNIKLRPLP